MRINFLPSGLPAALRGAGLTVIEVDGWRTRSRPASTGSFDPVGVLWHHTGSRDVAGDPVDDKAYAEWLANVGRSDLPAPLCQLSVSFEGVVYLIAAGRANHAGEAKPSGTVAGGDGNALYVGVECMNDGTQGFGPDQYAAMVTLGAVLMDVLGTSAQAQRAHRETSVTGKWDPGKLDMDDFRDDVAARNRALHQKPDPVREYPLAEKLLTDVDQLIRHLDRAGKKGGRAVRDIVEEYDRATSLKGTLVDLRADLRDLVGDS